MEGQCHAQNFFDPKVLKVSSQLEEDKPLGIACYDTVFLIAVKYLGFVCFKMAFIFLHVSVVTVTVALIMLHLIKRGTMSLLRYLWPYKVLQNSFLNSNPMFKSPDNVELSFARITKILTWVYWIVEIILVLINNSFIYCGFFKKKKKKALFWHIFSASLQKA